VAIKRACAFSHPDGRPCGAPPLHEGAFCRMHEPALAAEVQEGRRLGGTRRKRETVLAGAYDYHGLRSVEDIRRILEVAALDALALENSPARARLLLATVREAAALLKLGELAGRVENLEEAVLKRNQAPSFLEHGPWDDESSDPARGR
jgi:hypothetical protein